MGRLVILIGYTQGRPAAAQPWADILRTVGARLCALPNGYTRT
jgi:hypothetical protein